MATCESIKIEAAEGSDGATGKVLINITMGSMAFHERTIDLSQDEELRNMVARVIERAKQIAISIETLKLQQAIEDQ